MKAGISYFSITGLLIISLMIVTLLPQPALAQLSEEQLQQKISQTDSQLSNILTQSKILSRSIEDLDANLNDSLSNTLDEMFWRFKQYVQLMKKRETLKKQLQELELNAQSLYRKGSIQAKSTLLSIYRKRLAEELNDYDFYYELANNRKIWPYKEGIHDDIIAFKPRDVMLRQTLEKYIQLKKSGKKINVDEITRLLIIERDLAYDNKNMIRKEKLPKIKIEIKNLQKKIAALEKSTAVTATTATTAVAQNNTQADNYYRPKCPIENPGDAKNPNRLKYKFDTNNNPKDGDFVWCKYYRDGHLHTEKPFKNKKRHGISYDYFSSKPHYINWVTQYTNGVKDGTQTTFERTNNGHHYKLAEAEVDMGKTKQYTGYYEDGNIRYVDTYSGAKKNKKIRHCTYPKKKPVRCQNF